MKRTKPSYYDTFRCIAAGCPDSCCKEWDVQVDPEFAARYRSLPGELGDRLRSVLRDEDGDVFMINENGRCPMWRQDSLCRIQAELGEGALCKTCREFPRLTHDYGDFMELGLELSCPEAARIILSGESVPVTEDVSGGQPPEYDDAAMALLKASRKEALELLADRSIPVPEALARLLLYGYRVQEWLYDPTAREAEPAGREPLDWLLPITQDFDPKAFPDFFGRLDILTETWRQRLASPAEGPWEDRHRRLAAYFVERYWLQAVSDLDIYSRVRFMVVSCLVIRSLGGDLVETAQLYSKEIENNIDNVEAILDAACPVQELADPAFSDKNILGPLLEGFGGQKDGFR